MRRSLRIASVVTTLAAAACAAVGEEGSSPDPGPSTVDASTIDASTIDASTVDDGGLTSDDTCSKDGWCKTTLPDVDLSIQDIWPLKGRAFAIAASAVNGIKVLEWDDSVAEWVYIDDGSQNEAGVGDSIAKIWAPNDSEVYYAVAPSSSRNSPRASYIYHGTRSSKSPASWTWTRSLFSPPVGSPAIRYNPATVFGVWGVGGDVYAWYVNTVFRLRGSPGAPEWVPEYTLDGGEDTMFLFGVNGTSRDDLWLVGARKRDWEQCDVIVHKTAAGYRTVTDGTLADPDGNTVPCEVGSGLIEIGGYGDLSSVQSPSVGEIFSIKGADIARIARGKDGDYSVHWSSPSVAVASASWLSVWSPSTTETWLSGYGIIVRGSNFGVDGGTYEVSSIALNGAPLRRQFYQVRGTSSANLWAVGEGYALHKSSSK